MTHRPLRRAAVLGTAALLATGLAVAATVAPVRAAAPTIGVPVSRTIAVGTDLPQTLVANDGTIYASDGSTIEVWAPDSAGSSPDVLKTFSGLSLNGQMALDQSRGIAFVQGNAVEVMDPAQAAGTVVPTRTLTGPLTELDNPAGVAWTPNGSLWVYDDSSADGPELLRFSPSATGNVAPVQRIAGNRAGLGSASPLGSTQAYLAGMPDNGVAVSPPAVGNPTALVFRGGQSGDVAPAHRIMVPTPGPHWLADGLTSDSAGRIYIGSGDLNGNSFGRLDVYSRTGAPLLTVGGTAQRFQIPLLPSVSKNGTLTVLDTLIVALGSSPTQAGNVDVFKPLFTKPGAVTSLAVKKSASKATVSWKAPTNPSRTPLAYTLVVKKGSSTVLTEKTGAPALALARSSLPSGSLKVSVTARNVGGTGPSVSKTFTN